jgi:hypothetical protein
MKETKHARFHFHFHFYFPSSFSPPNFFPSTLSHHHRSTPTTTVQLRPPRSSADAHHPLNLPVWSFRSVCFVRFLFLLVLVLLKFSRRVFLFVSQESFCLYCLFGLFFTVFLFWVFHHYLCSSVVVNPYLLLVLGCACL